MKPRKLHRFTAGELAYSIRWGWDHVCLTEEADDYPVYHLDDCHTRTGKFSFSDRQPTLYTPAEAKRIWGVVPPKKFLKEEKK